MKQGSIWEDDLALRSHPIEPVGSNKENARGPPFPLPVKCVTGGAGRLLYLNRAIIVLG